MKKAIFTTFCVTCLAIGYLFGRYASAKSDDSAPAAENAKTATVNLNDLADAQKRIKELKRELAAARTKSKKDGEARPVGVSAPAANVDRGESNVVFSVGADIDILEEMKSRLSEDDFNRATNALVRLKENMAARAKSKIDFLKSVLTGQMTENERANHKKFIELMERRESVRNKMKLGLPDQATIQEMMQTEMQMASLAKKERETLSRQLATELGYSGEMQPSSAMPSKTFSIARAAVSTA